jgi:hypothetical protein
MGPNRIKFNVWMLSTHFRGANAQAELDASTRGQNRGRCTNPGPHWRECRHTHTQTQTHRHTHHDHIYRSQDESKNGPQLALESITRGVRHCIAQHFENAAQRNAKLPGRPILIPIGVHFPVCLGLGVYRHGVCLHYLQAYFNHDCFAALGLGLATTLTYRIIVAIHRMFSTSWLATRRWHWANSAGT